MGNWGGFDSDPWKGDGTLFEAERGWEIIIIINNNTPHLPRAICFSLCGVNLQGISKGEPPF